VITRNVSSTPFIAMLLLKNLCDAREVKSFQIDRSVLTMNPKAVKMAAALQGNINFNEAAAVEYLGPPVYTGPHQDDIRNIFQNAATFSQGSKWTPTPFKWDAYVRCDDWRSKCHRLGVDAYTGNYIGPPDFDNGPKTPDSNQEHDQSTMVMNFCPSFFNLVSFGEIVSKWKDEQNYIKYDLDWYRANRGKF
jgi:hypothetical protein